MVEVLGDHGERFQERARALADLMRAYPVFRFRPNPPQMEFIRHQRTKILGMVGGNKGGKECRADTPVLTPTGWRCIGDLHVGDPVIGGSGARCAVLGVYPQGKQTLYRHEFDDGTSLDAGLPHNWLVSTPEARFRSRSPMYGQRQVLTTEQILARYGPAPEATRRCSIPTAVSDMEGSPGLLDPYLMGALLGDGSFTHSAIRFEKPDEDVIREVIAKLPPRHTATRVGGQWHVLSIACHGGLNLVRQELADRGLLGKRSWEKFVPTAYLWSGARHRLSLLQGLLDTDGSASGSAVEFCSTSESLADAVLFLAQSLGGKATKHGPRITRYTNNGEIHDGRESWRVILRLPFMLPPFRSRAKLARMTAHVRTDDRVLHSIEEVGQDESFCIQVDDPTGTYVAKDFIVTHNTTIVAVKGMCNAWGFHPFLPPDDPDFRVYKPDGSLMRVPNIGQVAAEDYPNGIHRIQWPNWLKWLPKDSYKIAKSERGIVRELWLDVSEIPWADRESPLFPWSRVHFFAYEQGREPFAGFDPDWIINDEPLPRDIWIEQMRGLVPAGGPWMGAMTVVDMSQAWIYDIFEDTPTAKPWERDDDYDAKAVADMSKGLTKYMIHTEMRDNLKRDDGSGALTEKDVQDYEAMLTPDEREVRIKGGMVHRLGTEYGRYWDPSKHVLEEHREPDPDLPHIMACDPHPTVPFAMLWCEVNEDEEYYVWAEDFDWRHDTLKEVANAIRRTEKWKLSPVRRGFGAPEEEDYLPGTSGLEPSIRLMDPYGKAMNDREENRDTFNKMHERGLHFIPWTRYDKGSRVRNVREFLKVGFGPEGRPRLTISPNCRELIFELPRYREKMPSDPESMERKGEMLKVRDHLVDCLIAICNAQYPYRSLMAMKPVVGSDAEIRRRRPLGRRREAFVQPHGGY